MDNCTTVGERHSEEEKLQQMTDLIPEGLTLSFYSPRLKGAQLRLLAEAMNVPTNEETRQLIEGALVGQNGEPAMVQVILQERRKMVSRVTIVPSR